MPYQPHNQQAKPEYIPRTGSEFPEKIGDKEDTKSRSTVYTKEKKVSVRANKVVYGRQTGVM